MKSSRNRSSVKKDIEKKQTESVEMHSRSWRSPSDSSQEAMETDDLLQEYKRSSSSNESVQEAMDTDDLLARKKSSSSSSESVQDAMDTDDLLAGKKLMSELEKAEHLQFCMKLAAENKINAKNAFGLHLIDIMRHLSTTGHLQRRDLQEASLSLAASTSIYTCRVDALHKETMLFHSNLQTLSGKRSNKIAIDNEDDDAEDGNVPTSGKPAGRLEKKKFKSRLANEIDVTRLSFKDFDSISRQQPHENFSIINASFSCARTGRNLMHSLHLCSDDSRMDFTKPEKILRPKQNCSVPSDIHILPRICRELSDIREFEIKTCLIEELASEITFTTPFKSANRSWRTSAQFYCQDTPNNSFLEDNRIEGSVEQQNDVEYITEKMTSLDITCDIFVGDLTKALKEVSGGRDVTVDFTLLPVDSVLKRMIDSYEKTTPESSDGKIKIRRRKKAHVPFFDLKEDPTEGFDDVRLFNSGKNVLIAGEPSDWLFENTSAVEHGYTESDAEIDESEYDLNKHISKILKIETSERIRALKAPFLKGEAKVVQNSVKHPFFCIDSTKKDNTIEDNVMILTPANTKEVDEMNISFGQMTLHDNTPESDNLPVPEMQELELKLSNFDLGGDDDDFGEQSFIDEHILENLMVEPPVLVKPSFIKFEKKQTNVDTDIVKKEMFHIISSGFGAKNTGDTNLGTHFSEVYKELKKKKFEMSVQYAFVILLLLCNEKCFSLEPMKNSPDILIVQDVNEVQ